MRNLSVLVGLALLSALLVLVIALQYSYSTTTLLLSGIGLLILLASAGFLWFYKRRAERTGLPASVNAALSLGLVLGLLWVVEISINNFIAPPLPARDIIDDIFWALIALAMTAFSAVSAFRSESIQKGVQVGMWSGYAGGTIACSMGLAVVVFGMPWLLQDPLNIAEWSARGANSPATMAAYFAYETFAGSFGHLIILGIIMGALLGIVGGVGGRIAGMVLHFRHRTERLTS